MEGPRYGPHGAKAYSRACLCRGWGTAGPGALTDQNCKQALRGEPSDPIGQHAAEQLWRCRRRAMYICSADDTEWAVTVANRNLWWRAR